MILTIIVTILAFYLLQQKKKEIEIVTIELRQTKEKILAF